MSTIFLTIDQVCERVPGMTRDKLATRRYQRLQPRFFKPTPRTVLYREDDVEAWIESSVEEAA